MVIPSSCAQGAPKTSQLATREMSAWTPIAASKNADAERECLAQAELRHAGAGPAPHALARNAARDVGTHLFRRLFPVPWALTIQVAIPGARRRRIFLGIIVFGARGFDLVAGGRLRLC